MADTYLIANAPYGATDVLLTTAAVSGPAVVPSTGGVFDTIPLVTVRRSKDIEPDDEEAVLLALL